MNFAIKTFNELTIDELYEIVIMEIFSATLLSPSILYSSATIFS